MKREIKFRAWDSVNKKWLWPYPDGFSVIGEVTVFDLLKQQTPCPDIYGGIEICQFTDFHDKNGREIYEGDIIKTHTGDRIDELTLKVIFFEGGFCLTRIENGGNIICGKMPMILIQKNLLEKGIDKDASDVLEVIGNIYENPELLK